MLLKRPNQFPNQRFFIFPVKIFRTIPKRRQILTVNDAYAFPRNPGKTHQVPRKTFFKLRRKRYATLFNITFNALIYNLANFVFQFVAPRRLFIVYPMLKFSIRSLLSFCTHLVRPLFPHSDAADTLNDYIANLGDPRIVNPCLILIYVIRKTIVHMAYHIFNVFIRQLYLSLAHKAYDVNMRKQPYFFEQTVSPLHKVTHSMIDNIIRKRPQAFNLLYRYTIIPILIRIISYACVQNRFNSCSQRVP